MGTSLFFLLSFPRAHKKHKNANKRISDFFPLRCFFKRIFYFCSLVAFCAFAWLRLCAFVLLCFWCFWCFWCVQNLFVTKNKGFKTALITSFILLIKLCCKRRLHQGNFLRFFVAVFNKLSVKQF